MLDYRIYRSVPIYFRPFTGAPCPSVYNDRRGASKKRDIPCQLAFEVGMGAKLRTELEGH